MVLRPMLSNYGVRSTHYSVRGNKYSSLTNAPDHSSWFSDQSLSKVAGSQWDEIQTSVFLVALPFDRTATSFKNIMMAEFFSVWYCSEKPGLNPGFTRAMDSLM